MLTNNYEKAKGLYRTEKEFMEAVNRFNKKLPYQEALIRIFGVTNIVEAAQLIMHDFKNYTEDVGVISMAMAIAKPYPSYIISKGLLKEIIRVDFEPDRSYFPPSRIFIADENLSKVAILKADNGREWGISESRNFLTFDGDGERRYLTFPTLKKSLDEPHEDFEGLPLPPSEWTKGGRDEVSTITTRTIDQIIHYINHLGKPDLRPGKPITTSKRKKINRALKSEEFILNHRMVGLGFEKERLSHKEFWKRKAHLRMQPYGPRDNPKYKPVLIDESLCNRKSPLN